MSTMDEINIETCREALEETGETLSDDAIKNIVHWISGNYENRELLFAPVENPLASQIQDAARQHKKEVERLEEQSRETKRERDNNYARIYSKWQAALREVEELREMV